MERGLYPEWELPQEAGLRGEVLPSMVARSHSCLETEAHMERGLYPEWELPQEAGLQGEVLPSMAARSHSCLETDSGSAGPCPHQSVHAF